MKKMIMLAVLLSLAVMPGFAQAAAPAATAGGFEFTLGGYIALQSIWDSTQANINLNGPILRNNDQNFHHGRLKITANLTRFNFTIKGPKLWGAQVTGFIEADFNANGSNTAQADTTTAFRLRHAFFRLNWPETELLLGQYWGMFSEFSPEEPDGGSFQNVGSAVQRIPQIRLTQKFLGMFTVAGAIVAPAVSSNDYGASAVAAATGVVTAAGANANTDVMPGESSETPQLQGKIRFEKDFYGKAAFWGKPTPFTVQVAAGWQRTRYRQTTLNGAATWGQDRFRALGWPSRQSAQQYLDPWMVMGTLFIPVIPTHNANLAGTASLQTQWYVGQGTDVFGEGVAGNGSYWVFDNQSFQNNVFFNNYKRKLNQVYGGYVQAQYYFTNTWYINAAWGMNKQFGMTQKRSNQVASALNPAGYVYASPADQYKFWQIFNLTLWYRPITAMKFGLNYSYARTDWYQKMGQSYTQPTAAAPVGAVTNAMAGRVADKGEDHRVLFTAFYYF
ncbi:MAG: hypothetical protein AB1491_08875 [Thermodesulfobacteriota bacterium]